MALNWDKLQKLQRDYPKPKFAEKEITRQLKKKPKDPYLLAWKADNYLQVDKLADCGQTLIELLARKPPITDFTLLGYIYQICIGSLRRREPELAICPTAGYGVQNTWQDAAKSLPSRKARLDLWSSFFVTAMREGCWDDVRIALIQARQDGYKSNKRVAFALVLANQLTYEAYTELAQRQHRDITRAEKLQGDLALRQMQTAFSGPTSTQGDLIRVQDMRDLKFMGDIFVRHDRLSELWRLWDSGNAPQAMVDLMSKNYEDLITIRLSLVKGSKTIDWSEHRDYCIRTVSRAMESSDPATSLTELSTRSWHVWKHLIEATARLVTAAELPEQTIMEPVRGIIDQAFESGITWTGRSSALMHLSLTALAKSQLLPLCTKYWLENRHQSSCYRDLRAFVEQLSLEERIQFQSTITESARAAMPQSEQAEEATTRKWLHIETNVLKFHYLVTVCLPDEPRPEAISQLLCSTVRLYRIAAQVEHECCFDLGSLAVKTLGKLPSQNGLFITQATMLALHLTSDEFGKQNRPLLLFSTRIHMIKGFTAVAVDQYNHVRVKEILNDTLSHNLLTRISQVHPFDSKAMKVYPDQELRNVVSTIDRMERKVDDFLYQDMQDVQYDQTFELLDFKRQLRSSLTKHLCIIERRRIARLKGEILDDPRPSPITFENVSDNRDFDAWPNFDPSTNLPIESFCTVPPSIGWLLYVRQEREPIYWYLNEEMPGQSATWGENEVNQILGMQSGRGEVKGTEAEMVLKDLWYNLGGVTDAIVLGPQDPQRFSKLVPGLDGLLSELNTKRGFLEQLNADDLALRKTMAYEDQNIPSNETQMQLFYGLFEILQLVWTLCDQLDRKRKSAPFKAIVKNDTVKDLRDVTQKCYIMTQDLARAWIEHWKQHGQAIIKAQARYGETGQALRSLVADDELNVIARLYADSVIDTLGGVLQVRLFRK